MFVLLSVGYSQQDQNLTVNNASISPIPLEQGGTGEISFDFAFASGVTLIAGEQVKIIVSPTAYIAVSGPPTSSDPASPWTWAEDPFAPGTYVGTLSTDLAPSFTGEVFTFPIAVDPAAPVTNNFDYGFSADLTPHSRDPSGDTDDNVEVYTFMVPLTPIELISFDAEKSGNDAKVTWSTATETDNSHFEVEASNDGIAFQSVSRVASKGVNGNSNSVLEYTYTDKNAASRGTIQYYRLKNVDFDGTFALSEIAVVNFDDNSNYSVYPNPVIQGQDVLIQSNNITSIKVYSSQGKLIKEYNENGIDQKSISTSDFSRGVYFFLVNQKEGIKVIIE